MVQMSGVIFSSDGIAKGGELFGVYSFDDFLDDGSFEH